MGMPQMRDGHIHPQDNRLPEMLRTAGGETVNTATTCYRCGSDEAPNFIEVYDPSAKELVRYHLCDRCQIILSIMIEKYVGGGA